jgi:hypothetical protein
MSNNMLVSVLENGRQDVVLSLHGLPDELAAAKPAPDRWSALECMEHIIVVEERFLGWIAHGSVIETPEPSSEKENRLATAVRDRSTRAQAPEAVLPTGRLKTVESALAAFHEVRDLSVRVAKERGEALYAVGVKHARFGDMNGAELLHLLSGHASRHAAQIRETRAIVGAN